MNTNHGPENVSPGPDARTSHTRSRHAPGVWKRALDQVATAALIVAAVAVTWNTIEARRSAGVATTQQAGANRTADLPVPPDPISISTAALKGSSSAPLALVEYSDFQCPYCGRFARTVLPDIDKQFVATGKLLFALMPLPLPIHANAEKAAEAAECAGVQGHYWAMHDQLFRHQQELDLQHLRSFAGAEGVDLEQFDKCLAGEGAARIRASVASTAELGVRGTPTFFLGALVGKDHVRVARRLVGAIPFQQVTKAVNDLLAAHK